MGNLVFQATLGGQVNLVGPNTASTFNINVPTVNGNMVTTGDTGTVTNTMCATSVYTAPGTIGSGTPNTGAFTTLSASGVATISAGSASAPALTTSGDTNTGMLFPAADTIALTTGGSERLRLDSSGNLGLGVTPLNAYTGSGFKAYELPKANIYSFDLGSRPIAGFSVNSYLNSSAVAKYIATGYATLYESDQGQHRFYTAASGTAGNTITFTQAMTLDANGKLLVGGTTSDLSSTSQAMIMGSGGLAVQYTGTTGTLLQVVPGAANGTVDFKADARSGNYPAMTFYTSAAERARIDSSGNLLVGQTSVSQTANGVAIQYSGDATNLSRISVGGTGAGTGYSLYSGTASAYRFYVSYAGQIYATSTSITAISDQTLKTNVRDLETGLTEVMALKPRRFDWINGDATNVAGFIAQEVAEVFPELVDDYVYNIDEEGNTITKKSLKMGDILPTLVKAMQEQQAIITALTARITALEQA